MNTPESDVLELKWKKPASLQVLVFQPLATIRKTMRKGKKPKSGGGRTCTQPRKHWNLRHKMHMGVSAAVQKWESFQKFPPIYGKLSTTGDHCPPRSSKPFSRWSNTPDDGNVKRNFLRVSSVGVGTSRVLSGNYTPNADGDTEKTFLVTKNAI